MGVIVPTLINEVYLPQGFQALQPPNTQTRDRESTILIHYETMQTLALHSIKLSVIKNLKFHI